jgi:hypothetical protein
MDVIISDSAKAEILHAARYYEDEVEGLGKTFVSYVENSIGEVEKRNLKDTHIFKSPQRTNLNCC